MNIHHLELFYYVARHGGISEAVRHMPYGIQQPAVSGQIAQLEEHLGVTLFQRRPFSLTAQGQKLFNFVEPFFSNLENIESDLQGGHARHLRIGGSTVVLREYIPELAQKLRKKFPGLKLGLRLGHQNELESMLRKEEIDFAVTIIENKSAPRLHSEPLIELPLVLLVPRESKITEAAQLWKLDKIDEPLICLPSSETVAKNFQQGLAKIGIDWFPSIEAGALDLMAIYVAGGLGIGVSISIPRIGFPPSVRAIPLPGFPPIAIGAMWRGKASPIIQACFEEFRARASSAKMELGKV
jgi:DNA-binding transcriptional LysR family regulator